QKGFHFWRDAGVSAFVAGLAIVVIITTGEVVEIFTINSPGVVPIMGMVAIIISYMSTGKAFDMAGGLIGAGAGMAHGVRNGLQGRLSKFRGNAFKGRANKILNGQELYNNTNPIARRLNPYIQRAGMMPKALAQNPNIFNRQNYGRRGNWRSTTEGLIGNAEHHEADELREKNPAVTAVLGDDMKVWAIMETTSAGGEWARRNIDERLTDNAAGVRQSLTNHGFIDNLLNQGFTQDQANEQLNVVTAQ